MKVLHTIAGFGIKSGGTTSCTYDLLSTMNGMGGSVDLLTPGIPSGADDRLAGTGEEWIKAMDYDCRTPFAVSPAMSRYLAATDYDLYHTNGLWLHINHKTCALARKRRKPYVITPHGMLYPDALARSATRKKWMRRLLFDKDLHQAACIHATCEQEAEHIRRLGFRTPIAIISNPVKIPHNLDASIVKGEKMRENMDSVGYLGRLHPRKNVDRIINAFAKVATPQQKLVIIGAGQPEYESYLHDLSVGLGLKNVEFRGFLRDDDKMMTLAGLKALVVASDFENFGMIVAESLLCQTPVICTRTAPWRDLKVFDCGWWVDNDTDTLADAIYTALNMPSWRTRKKGMNGRDLIEYDYNPSAIARSMSMLYEWLGGSGDKPSFVI